VWGGGVQTDVRKLRKRGRGGSGMEWDFCAGRIMCMCVYVGVCRDSDVRMLCGRTRYI